MRYFFFGATFLLPKITDRRDFINLGIITHGDFPNPAMLEQEVLKSRPDAIRIVILSISECDQDDLQAFYGDARVKAMYDRAYE